MNSQTNKSNEEHLPRLYTKQVVLVFTCLVSSFFGGILYSQNLYEAGKKKEIPKVLIGCGLLQLIASNLLRSFSVTNALWALLIPNIVGALVLTQLTWNYHFADIDVYQKRKIWFPLILLIIIAGTFTLLNIYKK